MKRIISPCVAYRCSFCVTPLGTYLKTGFLLSCLCLLGCDGPYQPHPKDSFVYVVYPNTTLSEIIDNHSFQNCNGYFETSYESSSWLSISINTVIFYNSLGDAYLPDDLSQTMLNGRPFYDSVLTDNVLQNFDSLTGGNYTRWSFQLSNTSTVITDSIRNIGDFTASFPANDSEISLPIRPFTINYVAPNADSIYVEYFVYHYDSTNPNSETIYRSNFSSPNTGSLSIGENIIGGLALNTQLHFIIAAANQKVRKEGNNTYLYRTGKILHRSIKLTQ